MITITASDSGPAPASDVESVPANLDRGDAPRPTLTRRDVAPLSAAVQGPVLLPADPGFAAECATYNLLNPLRPALVVGASCVADVQAAVRFAGSRGMPVAVSATGHQVRQPANGSVLITLRRMVGTTVDVARRCVRIAGGTNWQEVVDAAAAHGLAPVNGSSMSVGAVGYLLGGGLSPTLGRTRGYGADTVRAVEIVTADGQLRHATASSEPDLFFAVRGGKGNFGVVTAIETDLFEVRRLYGGAIYFAGEHAPEVLHAWREWVVGLPAQMTTSVAIQRLPSAPELPEPIRGAFVVALRVAYLGSTEEGKCLVAAMRAAAPVLLDGVVDMPYGEVGKIHADPADPLPYVDRTTGLRALPPEAVDALLDVVGPDSDCPLASVEIRALGGALDRQAAVPNAVSPRGLPFVLFGFGVGAAEQAAWLSGYLTKVIQAVRPWADERSLPNFLSADEATTPAAVRVVYGADLYDRLARIKARWDPDNMFRMNHNIPPASDGY
ncbi:FAD-binding oxidoreductase [Micromonospora sp. NBC_00858]|uniref:FAD-binding oxidoreductase n=1 Tax=Micromonospora sp. NBC_00858 TaxID=2975979 RepID=UPI00386F2917|nr:FAD-binding oxidoreductase [Micromonospora sp. NBC_00858]